MVNAGMLVLFVIMTKVSIEIVPTITQKGTAISISRKWVFAAAAVGFLLSSIRMLQEVIKGIRNREEEN